jgi:hypothetical protein
MWFYPHSELMVLKSFSKRSVTLVVPFRRDDNIERSAQLFDQTNLLSTYTGARLLESSVFGRVLVLLMDHAGLSSVQHSICRLKSQLCDISGQGLRPIGMKYLRVLHC